MTDKPEKIRFRPPRLVLILVLFIYLYLTFTWANFWNTNEYSRMFLSRALIDNHKFSIDEIIAEHDTQDKSFFQGHYYSNKAPGSSFIAAPAYLLVRLAEVYARVNLSEEIFLYCIKVVCVSLPSAFFMILLFKFWAYLTLLYPVRRAMMIAYALGTLAWPYSTLFYSHQIATMSLFVAFLIIFVSKEMNATGKPMFEVGFFCGLAFCLEYPTLLISLLLFAYAAVIFKNLKSIVFLIVAAGVTWLLQDRFEFLIAYFGSQGAIGAIIAVGAVTLLMIFWQTSVLFFFLLGALFPVAAALFYHQACFGGVLNFPYYFETYQPFAIAHQNGIAGVTFPRNPAEFREHLSALRQLLISPYRGLFFYSPFLIFSLNGILMMIRDKEWRKEGCLFFGILVVYLLFLCSFTDWEGGWSMGPRHLTPLLPFLVTAVVYQLGKVGNPVRARLAWFVTPLLLISIFFTFLGTVVFPYFPKEFKNPLYELSWLTLVQGKFAPNIGEWLGLKGLLSLLPLLIALGVLVTFLLLDMSRSSKKTVSGRIWFSAVCVTITAVLLFLGLFTSLWRANRMSKRDAALLDYQERRVASFMQKDTTKQELIK